MLRQRLAVWWRATRPESVPLMPLPIVTATSMAVAADHEHWPSAAASLLLTIPILIGGYFSDDYFDHLRGAEKGSGTKKVMREGRVGPRAMLAATGVVYLLAALPASYVVARAGAPALAMVLAAVVISFLYSPLSYFGFGELLDLLYYVVLPFWIAYYAQAREITLEVVLASFSLGLVGITLIVLNYLRDLEGDRAASRRTLATLLGRDFGRWEYLVLFFVGSVVLPVALVLRAPDRIAVLLACGVFLAALATTVPTVFRREDPASLQRAMVGGTWLYTAFCFLFSFGWLLPTPK